MYDAIINVNEEMIQAAEKAAKNLLERDIVTIKVHDGRFHADDVMAVAIMKSVFGNIHVTRSREGWRFSDIIADVDGIFNPAALRFDHHQSDLKAEYIFRDETRSCKMAATGLVWQCLGRLIFNVNDPWREYIHAAIAQWLFQIDAIDNGRADLIQASKDITSLAEVLGMFNHSEDIYSDDQNTAFLRAVDVAYHLLHQKIRAIEKALIFEEKVVSALNKAHADDQIFILLEEGGPWRDHFINHPEKWLDISLVVFPSKEDDWRVQAVPQSPENLCSMKIPAPAHIRGLRDKELIDVTNISDATFIHKGGFLGGARSKSGAIHLAHYWEENGYEI